MHPHFPLSRTLRAVLLVSVYALSSPANAAPKPSPTPLPTASPSPSASPTFFEKARDGAYSVADTVHATLDTTRANREAAKVYLLANYSLVDLIIPSKYGATLGFVQNSDTTYELEYLRGTLSVPFLVEDLGSFKDERISLIRRSYWGTNSFNISYGLTYFRMKLRFGSDIIDRLNGNGNAYPAVDIMTTEALGFNVGIGNRWMLNKSITIGVDWISLSQPVFVTRHQAEIQQFVSNQNDRDNIETALGFMKYLPRFASMKIQVGIAF